MLVRDRMTQPVITVGPRANVSGALKLMFRRKVYRLPVLDEHGRLVGIVTRGTLLQHGTEEADPPVEAVMTPTPFTTHPLTPIEQAAVRMRDLRVGALPVLDQGRLVGIITESDIFDAFLELLGARSDARVTIALTDIAQQLPRLVTVAASTGVRMHGVTALSNGAGSFAIVSIDHADPNALVRALHEAGFTSTEAHTRG
ncbi:MAG TPA: CBS domain-containing protein [bacterium]|nr:CBS domain-containing protein [bacterium]